MEKEKETPEVSEETKVKMPAANPYSKIREDDPETEAFAKGELTKFQSRTKGKRGKAATEQKDTDASEETAENQNKRLLLSLNALLKLKIVFLRNVMTI